METATKRKLASAVQLDAALCSLLAALKRMHGRASLSLNVCEAEERARLLVRFDAVEREAGD